MRMPRIPLTWAAVAALWMSASVPVRAHEQWFSPSDFQLRPGQPVSLTMKVGEGMCGETLPFMRKRAVHLIARTRTALDLAPAAATGDSVWARFTPTDDAGVLFGWESNFVDHQMPAQKFEQYLLDEGLDGPLAVRRARSDTTGGRERYRRCTKVWLRGAAGDTAGGERATRMLGFPLEIVPAAVPGAGPVLPIRTWFEGKPLAHVLVRAWRAPFEHDLVPGFCAGPRGPAEVFTGHTDAEGRIDVPCAEPGQWLIGVVYMVPSESPEDADWQSTWASLGFARAAEGMTR